MNNTFLLILLLFFQVLSTTSLVAAETTTDSPSWMNHLVIGEVETIELHSDLSLLLTREPANEEYQDARIIYTDNNNQAFSWSIGIKPRGKYRRRICDFPPIKLNFSKKELNAGGLAAYDKYKLVTHCTDDRFASKEAIIREYLTYQLYQDLTPESFHVRLLRIRYVDTSGEQTGFYRYGFIIESDTELEKRLNVQECKDCFISMPSEVNTVAENKMAVFQYMIGNTDFGIAQARNLKYFTPANGGPLIPVAYDFDFAALVAPGYAIPSTDLGQEKLTDRVYLGFAVADELMEQTLAYFEERRAVFLTTIRNEKRLSLSARSEMRAYINNFFTSIETLKQESGSGRTYYQLRQSAPQVVPPGGNPVHYGVSK